MARDNFQPCLDEVLLHEGGFVNHPKDPGGMTNLGVTRHTYESWVGYPVSEAIMRKLTPHLVSPLYKRNYWLVCGCDDLKAGLDLCVFDFAVNAGPQRAIRYLQTMVGATADGVMGPKTRSLTDQYVNGRGLLFAVSRYSDLRREYYPRLQGFGTFGRGWMRRVKEVESTALKMARRVTPS